MPRRDWHKYLLNTPGVYIGYNVTTVAAVREAIEGLGRGGRRDWAGG